MCAGGNGCCDVCTRSFYTTADSSHPDLPRCATDRHNMAPASTRAQQGGEHASRFLTRPNGSTKYEVLGDQQGVIPPHCKRKEMHTRLYTLDNVSNAPHADRLKCVGEERAGLRIYKEGGREGRRKRGWETGSVRCFTFKLHDLFVGLGRGGHRLGMLS